jgi:glutamate formiminotransferase / 5-formyltetrahydrofolate cyclo-ligase
VENLLLAVPNVSEGRDQTTVEAIGAAFAGGVRLLDTHSDGDHHRSVFTLAGPPGALGDALLRGACATVQRINIEDGRGVHPHVGAIDVVPVVYLDEGARGAACAEALVVADRIGNELNVPVFLYGVLTGDPPRTRAGLRRGGVKRLAERMRSGELHPDFGPSRPHPSAGVTLVAARPPLVAFNLQLASGATVADARQIASLIREGGAEGLPGLRAIGLELGGGVAQVSMNIERPFEMTLATVVAAVRRHAEVANAELVGLAPRSALENFPDEVQFVGLNPEKHVIENILAV